eukprot:gene12556-6376_t
MNEEIEKFCLDMQRPPPLSPTLGSIGSIPDDISDEELSDICNGHTKLELDDFSKELNDFYNFKTFSKLPSINLKQFEKYSISEEKFKNLLNQNEHKIIEKIQEKKKLQNTTVIPSIEKSNKMTTKKQEMNQKEVSSQYLNQLEHKEFLNLEKIYLEVQQNPFQKNLYAKQLERYSYLRNFVLKEQTEFKRKEYNEALQKKDEFNFIHPKVLNQIEQIFEFKKKRILCLPNYYKTNQVLNIKKIKLEKNDPILSNPEIIIQLGKVNTLEKSIFKKNLKFPIQNEVYQLNNDDLLKNEWIKRSMPELSSDPVAEDISKQFQIPFIISSSSFCSIIDISKEFCIPIKIKLIDGRKTIFFDKPILKKKYTIKEKNQNFYNLSFKNIGINMSKESPVVDFNKNNSNSQKFEDFISKIENYTYTCWNLGKFKLLIRTKLDAVVPDELKPSKFSYVGIKTKPEYFPQKGEEEFTWSELARNWAYTYIRHDTQLYISRISPQNNELISIETKNVENLIFRPEQSIKLFYTILEKLNDLPIGQYLVSHLTDSDEKFSIFENVSQENSTYDLHYDFRNAASSDILSIPYVPIKWKNVPNQIPYTFKPKNQIQQKSKKKKKNSTQPNPPSKISNQTSNVGMTNSSSSLLKPVTPDENNDDSKFPEVLRNDQDLEHIMKNFL